MKVIFTYEQLDELYNKRRLSMRQIALELGCSQTYIWKHLQHHNIPRRERSDAMKMITKSLEHRQKLADIRFQKGYGRGEDNHNWTGGNSRKLNDRNQIGISYWKNSVKRRDKFTCKMCGVSGLNECKCCGMKPTLHAHHLKSWKDHPELRFDINNGITLCEKCHRGLIRITGLIAGTPSNEGNQQPSVEIANRLNEGSTVSPDESIMDTNAPLERDDMTCSAK